MTIKKKGALAPFSILLAGRPGLLSGGEGRCGVNGGDKTRHAAAQNQASGAFAHRANPTKGYQVETSTIAMPSGGRIQAINKVSYTYKNISLISQGLDQTYLIPFK
jgi:hypothetical protein